jgi:hypothetical protein
MDRTARTSVLLFSTIILGTTSVAYGQTTRRSFQMSVNLELGPGLNANVARLPIPAGKRFVIEDVSAVTFQPAGQPLLLDFTTPADDGCSFEDVHNVVLISQRIFGGLEWSTGHERTLIFADESVQTNPGPLSGLGVTVTVWRSGIIGSASVRVTFSGYVEDLSAASHPSFSVFWNVPRQSPVRTLAFSGRVSRWNDL